MYYLKTTVVLRGKTFGSLKARNKEDKTEKNQQCHVIFCIKFSCGYCLFFHLRGCDRGSAKYLKTIVAICVRRFGYTSV
jgi:hypothetical protein